MSEITEVHSIEYLNDWGKPTIVDVTFSHSNDDGDHFLRTKCVLPSHVNTYSEVSDALMENLSTWVSGLETKTDEVEL